MAIKLDLETVKHKARDYYERGKLTAQNSGLCHYRHYDCACAIGAAISDDDYNALLHKYEGARVKSLKAEGVLEVNETELSALMDIQWAHDDWCNALDEEEATQAELRFCNLIDAEARLAA